MEPEPEMMMKKGSWSPEEDALLTQLVDRHGPHRWSLISAGIPGRSGKSCRLRWCNQLSPDVHHRPFTPHDDKVILAAHARYGNKWATIARLLPGRTDNSIKNHWNSNLRRCRRRAAKLAEAAAAAPSVSTSRAVVGPQHPVAVANNRQQLMMMRRRTAAAAAYDASSSSSSASPALAPAGVAAADLLGPNPNNNDSAPPPRATVADPPTSLSLSLALPLPLSEPEEALADEAPLPPEEAMMQATEQPSPPLPGAQGDVDLQMMYVVRQMVREEVQRQSGHLAAYSLMAAAAWAKGQHR